MLNRTGRSRPGSTLNNRISHMFKFGFAEQHGEEERRGVFSGAKSAHHEAAQRRCAAARADLAA